MQFVHDLVSSSLNLKGGEADYFVVIDCTSGGRGDHSSAVNDYTVVNVSTFPFQWLVTHLLGWTEDTFGLPSLSDSHQLPVCLEQRLEPLVIPANLPWKFPGAPRLSKGHLELSRASFTGNMLALIDKRIAHIDGLMPKKLNCSALSKMYVYFAIDIGEYWGPNKMAGLLQTTIPIKMVVSDQNLTDVPEVQLRIISSGNDLPQKNDKKRKT